MSFQHGAISGQVCDSCGYSLDGLPVGTKCPECGHSSAHRSTNIRESTMSFQAPPRYVKWVRNGFYLCMLAIFGGLATPIVGMASGATSILFPIVLVLFVAASCCWPAGVWMITRPRTGIGPVTHDDTLDNPHLVKAARILSFVWPCWIILMINGAISGTLQSAAAGAGGMPMVYSIVTSIVGLIAWLGLIPACLYFGELAHWAADQWLANRLRSTAWVMMVFGFLMIIARFLMLTNLPISHPAKIVNLWMTILVFIATIVLFYSIFRMSILMDWVLSHQKKSAGKHARLTARIEKQMTRGSVISNKTACEYCGYNLEGLPFNGHCPECGQHYGDNSMFPIRDPAHDTPKHDGSAIGVEESTHAQIKFNRTLGTPLEDVSDREIEGGDEIPLADE